MTRDAYGDERPDTEAVIDETLVWGRDIGVMPPIRIMPDLRDWFAMAALPYSLSRDYGNDWGQSGSEHILLSAKAAYRIADAMMKERQGHD